jgi:polyisoprenoid-binding protein YceI
MTSSTPAVSRARLALAPAGACLLAIAALLSGCSENPANKSTPAEVSSPAATPAAKPAANARTFVFAEDSTIGFVGSKVTGKHNGGFKKFGGQFALADAKLSGSGHKVVIDMTSTWADNNRLEGHLKSPDFFDVAKFPEAVFELTSLDKSADGKTKLTGNLTLHGVTKQISFPAEVQVQGDQAMLKAEFFIKRFDFGIKFPGKADDLIRDEVVIKLDLKAKAKA